MIHASANEVDAIREIPIWFKDNEILNYKRDDECEHYYC